MGPVASRAREFIGDLSRPTAKRDAKSRCDFWADKNDQRSRFSWRLTAHSLSPHRERGEAGGEE